MSSEFGANSPEGSTLLRWGVLGTGRIGRVCVIPALVRSRNGKVTALASRSLSLKLAIALEAVRMSRRRMFFDAAKAVRELGLPQTPTRTAFEDAVGWFQGKGLIPQSRRRNEAWASR